MVKMVILVIVGGGDDGHSTKSNRVTSLFFPIMRETLSLALVFW